LIKSFVGYAKPDSAAIRADSIELARLSCDARPFREPLPSAKAGLNRFT